MGVIKKNGHGTTGVLKGADNQTVISAPIKFPTAVTQNGGFPNRKT